MTEDEKQKQAGLGIFSPGLNTFLGWRLVDFGVSSSVSLLQLQIWYRNMVIIV